MSTANALLPRPRERGVAVKRDPRRRGARGLQGRLGRQLVSVLHVAALALVIAGIVHIAVVLLVPQLAQRDAWAKLSAVTRSWRFSVLSRPIGADGRTAESAVVSGLDPRFAVAACRFDLREAPAAIVAEGDVPFWSVAVFDRRGEIVYSFNDRTAIDGRLDMIVLTPAQRARLREAPPDGLDRSILVPTGITQGFVVVRAMAPDETWANIATRFARRATCERVALPPPIE